MFAIVFRAFSWSLAFKVKSWLALLRGATILPLVHSSTITLRRSACLTHVAMQQNERSHVTSWKSPWTDLTLLLVVQIQLINRHQFHQLMIYHIGVYSSSVLPICTYPCWRQNDDARRISYSKSSGCMEKSPYHQLMGECPTDYEAAKEHKQWSHYWTHLASNERTVTHFIPVVLQSNL